MKPATNECEIDGCRNRVNVASMWNMCMDCFIDIPDYIPFEQSNYYVKKKKEGIYETSNDM